MEVEGSARELVSSTQMPHSTSRQVIPINEGWVFKQSDSDAFGFLPVAQFPTNVHLDLMFHKQIPDPFVGKNEDAVQWVGEKSWTYKNTFPSPVTSDEEKAVLVFHGLDTHAAVFLNGRKILETENMFIPERVDVSKLLRSGSQNVLEIIFESTWLVGKKLVEKYPDHGWGCWNGDVSRLAVRKAQYHYVCP
jgi:beta-mannosidase